jgi:hypothetical protein
MMTAPAKQAIPARLVDAILATKKGTAARIRPRIILKIRSADPTFAKLIILSIVKYESSVLGYG